MRIGELRRTLQHLLVADSRPVAQLAEKIGVSPQYLRQVLQGERGLAVAHVDAALAALGLELELSLVPLEGQALSEQC